MSTTSNPLRGEIWQINFDPTVGHEIRKKRPAIVLSSDAIRKLSLRLVVPVTEWQPSFESSGWHVKLMPDKTNNLSKESAADALQVRSVGLERFSAKIGRVTADQLEEIALAVGFVIELK